MQPLCCARDVVLGQQHVERQQQVQVQAPEIIHRNTEDIGNSFPIYRTAGHPWDIPSLLFPSGDPP
ncbi:hypothetical protein D3C71_1776190 [compost metagenome]